MRREYISRTEIKNDLELILNNEDPYLEMYAPKLVEDLVQNDGKLTSGHANYKFSFNEVTRND